jgi:uncharacterized protein DUF397
MASTDKLQWRKSRHCDTGDCVEVAVIEDGVLVRHSSDPDGPRLWFSEAEWKAFIRGASAGEFDHS